MLFFYIWIMLDFIANFTWLVLSIQAASEQLVFVVYAPATFKVLIGIEQIWLMVELIAQID